jgi:DNA-binding CsgD family transcriptional regulator
MAASAPLFSKNSLICLIGMTLFLTYFRYQSIFGYIFPADMRTIVAGQTIGIYPLFLIILLLTSLAALAASKQLAAAMTYHRPLILVCTTCGTLGIFLCILHTNGMTDDTVLFPAMVLVAVGFLAALLAWASYFSASFGFPQLIILVTAYFLSLLFFTIIGKFFSILKDYILVVLPLGTGVLWLLADRREHAADKGILVTMRSVKAYVVLYIAFLLIGSVIRGIVDLEHPTEKLLMLRWIVSLTVSLVVLLICLYVYRHTIVSAIPAAETAHDSKKEEGQHIENLTLKLWITMTVLFLGGTFVCLIAGSFAFGGHVVVVARSSLDMLLWIALCNLTYLKKIAPIPLFLICVVFVETISWLISYVLVPSVALFSGADGKAYEVLVLAGMSPLIIGIVIWVGFVSLRKEKITSAAAASGLTETTIPRLSQTLIEHHGLTKREIEVIGMVAQGYTLKVVAERLFISKSTAQSHIKSIYRKLGIHSKNELIEILSPQAEQHEG